MTERLQNLLSHAGVCSRRHAADLTAAGRVTVNGRAVFEPGFRVDPEKDAVALDGKPLAAPERKRTIVMYKPVGVLSAASDERGGKTVNDLIRHAVRERLVPVGRLDKESEGLLLMSNDGDLVLRLTHPRYGHEKLYLVRAAGRWTQEKLDILRSPLEIDGYAIRPCKVDLLREGRDNVHDLLFRLKEGRKRQIRKMCSCAHLTVLALKRVCEGPLSLGGLRPGEWRDLEPGEIAALERGTAAPRSLPPGEWPPHYEFYPANDATDGGRPAPRRTPGRDRPGLVPSAAPRPPRKPGGTKVPPSAAPRPPRSRNIPFGRAPRKKGGGASGGPRGVRRSK